MKSLICNAIIKIQNWLSKKELTSLYKISDLFALIVVNLSILEFYKKAHRNFISAFPDRNSFQIKEIEKKYYHSLCGFMAESIKSIDFTAEEMKQRVKYKNLDTLNSLLNKYKYVVCYSGHVANYEWMVGLPLHIQGYTMCNFYFSADANNPIEKHVKQTRSRFGAKLIPTKSPIKEIIKLKDLVENEQIPHKGFVIGSLADLPASAKDAYRVKFLNKSYKVQTGTEKIGRKLNAAFVYGYTRCITRGYYEIEIQELNPSDADFNMFAYTEDFFRHLEKNIQEQPELWMLWGNF